MVPIPRMKTLCVLALATAWMGCSQPGETEIARGNILASTGKLDEAAAAYKAAATAAPKRSRPLELLGHVLSDQNKLAEARLAYEQAINITPDALEANIGLAKLDAEEGKMDEAVRRLDALLEQQKDNLYALLSRANLLVKRNAPGDAERAIQDTAFAMRIDEKNPSVLYARGTAFLAAGKPQEALEAFALLTQRHPQSPLGYYGTARVRGTQGDKAGALAQLKETRSRTRDAKTWKPSEVLSDTAFQAFKEDPEFAASVPIP
jgi:predicted Zn-dependent protease